MTLEHTGRDPPLNRIGSGRGCTVRGDSRITENRTGQTGDTPEPRSCTLPGGPCRVRHRAAPPGFTDQKGAGMQPDQIAVTITRQGTRVTARTSGPPDGRRPRRLRPGARVRPPDRPAAAARPGVHRRVRPQRLHRPCRTPRPQRPDHLPTPGTRHRPPTRAPGKLAGHPEQSVRPHGARRAIQLRAWRPARRERRPYRSAPGRHRRAPGPARPAPTGHNPSCSNPSTQPTPSSTARASSPK